MIALILSGLASIPLVDTKQPNTLPLVTPKNALLRVEFEVCLVHISEGLGQVRDVLLFLLACDYDVLQCCIRHSTKHGTCVAQPLRHSHIAICAK
jgi:hypothetical protein